MNIKDISRKQVSAYLWWQITLGCIPQNLHGHLLPSVHPTHQQVPLALLQVCPESYPGHNHLTQQSPKARPSALSGLLPSTLHTAASMALVKHKSYHSLAWNPSNLFPFIRRAKSKSILYLPEFFSYRSSPYPLLLAIQSLCWPVNAPHVLPPQRFCTTCPLFLERVSFQRAPSHHHVNQFFH